MVWKTGTSGFSLISAVLSHPCESTTAVLSRRISFILSKSCLQFLGSHFSWTSVFIVSFSSFASVATVAKILISFLPLFWGLGFSSEGGSSYFTTTWRRLILCDTAATPDSVFPKYLDVDMPFKPTKAIILINVTSTRPKKYQFNVSCGTINLK